jgi:hypothetical protein
LALCLSLFLSPALHAQAPKSGRARSRQAQTQPAGHGILSTLWSYIVTTITGAPPSPLDPTSQPTSDLGGAIDPNGTRVVD